MNSDTPSLADLEARLAKLERQNRRLKRLGLLFLLIAGAGFLLAQAPRKPPSAAPGAATPAAAYDTLVVHRLELRDKAGKLRGVWSGSDEAPGLALYDPAGETRALLSLSVHGPSFSLWDAAGKPRAELTVTTRGPDLLLSDAAGKTRAALNVTPRGPSLWLLDTAEKTRISLGLDTGSPVLALSDPAGNPHAVLTEGRLSLQDAQQFKAVVGVVGTKEIDTGESRTTSAAAVTLFDKDGKVIWQAP